MTLTLDIPNNTEAQRLVDDLCAATNYDPASGIPKGQWVKDKIIDFIRSYAKRGEIKVTANTISTEIDAIVIN